MISFFVAGIPKAAPRPRRAKNGHFYVPDVDKNWKEAIAWKARERTKGKKMTGPVWVELLFGLPIPKTTKKHDGEWHIIKPDCDNLSKSCLDAMTMAGVWEDDCQVCQITVGKNYSANPGVLITIESI